MKVFVLEDDIDVRAAVGAVPRGGRLRSRRSRTRVDAHEHLSSQERWAIRDDLATMLQLGAVIPGCLTVRQSRSQRADGASFDAAG